MRLTDQKLRERRQMVREMTTADALQELADKRLELFNLRVQATRGELKNVRLFAQTKKDIARLLFKLHMEALHPEELEFVDAEDALPAGTEELELPPGDEEAEEEEATK
jgi:ribosomal protein L29